MLAIWKVQQWLCAAEDINEKEKGNLSSSIDRTDAIRLQLSSRRVIYFETTQVLDAMVLYMSVSGRHDPTLSYQLQLRYREIRFASASTFLACHFFFYFCSSHFLFSNCEKTRGIVQHERASKTCICKNSHRKNTAKKCVRRYGNLRQVKQIQVSFTFIST